MYQLNIQPADKLFFRDARPMSGSSIGNGSEWPLPSVLHSALQSAIYEYWVNLGKPDWESDHKNMTNKEKERKDKNKYLKSTKKFGGLKTIGPFPQKNGEIFFPTPADIEPNNNLMKPSNTIGSSNLSKPLKYTVVNTGVPTKDVVGQWISASELTKYLDGVKELQTSSSNELYISEAVPGVAIDPDTRTNTDGKFFQSEYLRLLDSENVSIAAFGECIAKKFNGEEQDIVEKLFNDTKQLSMIFGGQRGTAYVSCMRTKNNLFDNDANFSGKLLKLTLLSPAVFSKGWLPDWVNEDDGRVELKCRPDRNEYQSRNKWREAIKNSKTIGASLVAARIPKPISFSGWKLDMDKDNAGGVPKATRVAVPAGAVYYFECDDEEQATILYKELHGNIKSTFYGNHGFGLGVCSNWNLINF